jgi:hypothetical protein
MVFSLFGLLVLVADIMAIIKIANARVSGEKKALWIVIILLLPLAGFFIWYFFGPKE